MEKCELYKFEMRWNLVRLVIILSIHLLGISEGAPDHKEYYDFEELDVESTTIYSDIDYSTSEPEKFIASDTSCECGKSTSLFENNLRKQINSDTIRRFVNSDSINSYIINGSRVHQGEAPWMVAITKYQHKTLPRWRVICGGSLINEKFILTAAHCLFERFKDTLEVVLNVDDATKIVQDKRVIRRKIQKFIIHPDFNPVTIDNDIALIEMKDPIDLTRLKSKARPICLPYNLHKDFSKYTGTVSGWGYTKYQGGEPSPNLLKLKLPILSRAECLKTKVQTKNNVTENMFCSGYLDGSGGDACINDSGGPLSIQHGDSNYIIGIVSWGVGCSLKGYPGIYTKVSNYIPWIQKNSKVSRSCL